MKRVLIMAAVAAVAAECFAVPLDACMDLNGDVQIGSCGA